MNRMMRQRAPQDPVDQAKERVFHVNAVLLGLLKSWREAAGEPDMRDRVQALGSVGHALEIAIADAQDIDGLLAARGAIAAFVTAIKGIYHDQEAVQHLHVLRSRLCDLLAATYGLEQVIEKAVACTPTGGRMRSLREDEAVGVTTNSQIKIKG